MLPHLIRHFLAQLGAEDSEHLFGPQVIAELSTHEWPGNVRELRNYVERSVVLQNTRMSMLPQPRMPTPSKPDLSAAAMGTEIDVNVPYKVAKEALVDQFERGYVKAVLAACSGNLTKAAKMAGIDRMYLHRLVQKHARRDEVQSASSLSEPSSAQQRKPVE